MPVHVSSTMRSSSRGQNFIKPLTPDLNPSEQRCLPEFFTGDFKFQCILRRKVYLIDFTLKFNEIKFCSLLVNCLIWKKMFT